jgi:short subunit fatty acids transporter
VTAWVLLALFVSFYIALIAWGLGLYVGERRAAREFEAHVADSLRVADGDR